MIKTKHPSVPFPLYIQPDKNIIVIANKAHKRSHVDSPMRRKASIHPSPFLSPKSLLPSQSLPDAAFSLRSFPQVTTSFLWKKEECSCLCVGLHKQPKGRNNQFLKEGTGSALPLSSTLNTDYLLGPAGKKSQAAVRHRWNNQVDRSLHTCHACSAPLSLATVSPAMGLAVLSPNRQETGLFTTLRRGPRITNGAYGLQERKGHR